MPKFTITTDHGQGAERWGEPFDFPHTKAATDDAQIALSEMAREQLPIDKRADFGVVIENEDGKEIYRAALHIETKCEADLDAEASPSDVASQLDVGPRE